MNDEVEEGYITRIREELFDLVYKYDKLTNFLDTSEARSISLDMQTLLCKQVEIMEDYIDVLNERLDLELLEG